ncbi:MAG: hypothetical protein DRH08_00240 [Deltaproteobacteria bacterium]|nr:MAG: hypothetical protein DRH08_00240 [Deltaproteobacteria bacterium]
MEDGSGSDIIAMVMDEEDVDAPAALAAEFDLDTVTFADVDEARQEVYDATQRSLTEHGTKDTVELYRGGAMKGIFTLFPFTFSDYIAMGFARRSSSGIFYTCLVDRRFIAADIDLFQFSYSEDEVLVYPEGLLDCSEELILP